MAREFTWGVANGWSDDWYPNRWGTEKRTAEAACAFARARELNRDVFVYGTLEDELRPLEPVEKKRVVWEQTWNARASTGEVAVVTGAWWTDRGGRKTLVAVNLTDERQGVSFRIPGRANETGKAELAPREIHVKKY